MPRQQIDLATVTYDLLDALVDTDPLTLRDIALAALRDLRANEGAEDARLSIAEATIERLTGPEARERLARHLWTVEGHGDPQTWDNLADELAKLRARGENGEWLARGVEKSVTRLREQAARYVAVIAGKEG